MKKETIEKKHLFCDNCGISISDYEYVEFVKTKTEKNWYITKIDYKDKQKLCNKCAEKTWSNY